MRYHPFRTLSSLVVCGTLLPFATLFTGCKTNPTQQAAVINADGSTTNADGSITFPAHTVPPPTATTNADGSITNPNGSVTYPAGSPQANREGSRTPPQPSAVPRAPVRQTTNREWQPTAAHLTIASGSEVIIRTTETLSASRNNVGDRFTGVLNRALVSGGATIFPRGTEVSGQVVAAKGKGRFQGSGDIGIELTSIGRDVVSTREYEAMGKGRGERTAAFMGSEVQWNGKPG